MQWLSRKSVSAEVAVRAMAISTVTFNHAQKLGWYPDFGGGMSFLMALSGYNFAKFAMHNRTPADVRRALLNLSVAIALPTMLVILGSFIVTQKFEWSEFFLYSNLFTPDHVTWMYIWYPQVLVQILLGLWVVFSIPPVANLILRNPFWSSLTIFAGAVVVRSAFANNDLWNQLPHLFLWNFVLGWLVFFTLEGPAIGHDLAKKGFLLACTLVGSIVAWSVYKANPYVTTVLMGAFLFARSIPMPSIMAKGVNLVSQATFGIFLLHFAFLTLYDQYFEQDTLAKFSFGMILSIAVWLVVTSTVRAYKTLRKPAPAAAPPQHVAVELSR